MLIARAELAGRAPLDVRLAGGRIEAIGERLARRPGEPVLDAAGGALIPGLHDHHLHLFALAASARSLRCGPPQVRDARALARALREAPGGEGWIRGTGYHESVAGELDRGRLDALVPARPLRIQHRSGALWILNSRAVAELGLDAGADAPGAERGADGRATGRLFDADTWLRGRIASEPPRLADVGRRLASYGVTGVTDATPGNAGVELCAFTAAIEAGELPQRVLLMGTAELPAPRHPRLARGALKLTLAERALPEFDAVRQAIVASHGRGRPVAVHCVTRAELVFALAAFAAAGARAGDRIEHAAVAPPEVVERLAALPLTVVTQPNFVRERGDAYVAEVAADERPWLYRCGGLLAAGIPVAAGSDAPFGDADPWRAMRAAVERRSEAGVTLGADERLAPERALALFTSPAESPGAPPRRVAEAAIADLCLLARPWAAVREELSSADVVATFRAGELVWWRERDAP